jgi:signal transduction histidine kinase
MTLEAEHTQHNELERLRAEIAELRASRARLVLAADADCRWIERELHGGVQHLVALAVKLQLARPLADANPAATRTLLEEMEGDVQQALEEAARLAERIYPQLPEAGGLAAALRSAAVSAGVTASVDVTASSASAPEILRTVYLCWLEVLEQARGRGRPTAIVRDEEGALTFEFTEEGDAGAREVGSTRLDQLRGRVEALGGRLTVESNAGGTSISGWLPVSS